MLTIPVHPARRTAIVRPSPVYRLVIVLAVCLFAGGCASMATQRLSGSLSHAMLNQDDPATVKAGAPAYLLLLDGLIEETPDDRALLIAAARLYSAYGVGMVQDPERAQRLSAKARGYSKRALCAVRPQVCTAEQESFQDFSLAIAETGEADLEALYAYGVGWAAWIQARSGDWNALADLPRVEAVFERIVALDPGHDRGRAQLYLAVMRTQLSPSLGGKPELGRAHFKEAVRFSAGRDLMAKVEYARRYARLVFNQPLHDRLLNEVLAANPIEPDLTLSNVMAQQQAKVLLADGYFD